MPQLTHFNGKPIDTSKTNVNFQVDLIANPLGIINRLNDSQDIEVETNYISKFVRLEMEKMFKGKKPLDEILEYFLNYMYEVNQKEYDQLFDFIERLNRQEKIEFIKEIISKGIPIHQAPFWDNINILGLRNLYKYTGVGRCKFNGIENEFVYGEKYYMLLKHLTSGKLSSRSSESLNIRNLPVKSEAMKYYKTPYSNTPIKIGEMEHIGMGLANSAENGSLNEPKKLTDAYANNEIDRVAFIEAQLTENPFDFDFENSNTESINSKIAHAFMNCIGFDLVDDENEENED